MYPELVDRPDLKVFLPPIGGTTIYCFGDPQKLADPNTPLACRVHDECNGSDVFGSDICTCRPYLAHGIEIAIQMAQAGGVGLVVYNRKEGRALGEVTKFLVYNARKRQKGGDRPEDYFNRTACVAGVEDMRFQELMPDVLHWLGITRIHRFASMSDMKCDALMRQGITDRRARVDPRRADSEGCPRRDRSQDRGRLFRRRQAARRSDRRRSGGRSTNDATASRGQPSAHRIAGAQPAAIAALRSADAVRERCRMVHRLGGGRPLAALHHRAGRGWRPSPTLSWRGDARRLSRPAHPLSQPLAAFRRRRRRSLAGARRRDCRPIRWSVRARRSISRP